MTTTKPTKEKKKNANITHIKRDWMVYAALTLALIALLWTWSHQYSIEQKIRTEYKDYLEECRTRCGGGIQWNGTIEPSSSTLPTGYWD